MPYQRQLDVASNDSLARVLRRIPAASRVLELGPATGYLSRHLHQALGCTVDAIELSASMAEEARPWCRRLVVGDPDVLDADELLAGERYDVIVCADVLEQLRAPWTLLERLAPGLVAGGRLLLSVPNVAYLGLTLELLRGRFRYRDEGLLDRRHLRFFTLESLCDVLARSGWHVWDAEPVAQALTDSEFHVRLETLAPQLRDELLSEPHALCYQWVIEARREEPPLAFSPPPRIAEDTFQVRIFWRAQEANFDYSRNRLARAPLGGERCAVSLDLPRGQRALALRLSDRVGFVRLHAVRLRTEDGATLWSWFPGASGLPVGGLRGIEAATEENLWFVRHAESLLTLELPGALVAATQRVELELDAPLSADYLAAHAYWNGPDGLPARLQVCEANCRRLALRGFTGSVTDTDTPCRSTVIHVLPAVGGGIERFARDLCRATAQRYRHLLLRVTETSWHLEDAATARFWPLPAHSAAAVVDVLAALQPALVHLHTTAARPAEAATVIAARCNARLGVTLHDVLFANPDAFRLTSWQDEALTADPARAGILGSASFVTAPSQYIATIAGSVYGVQAEVVPNGIEDMSTPPWNDDGEVEIGGRRCARRIVALGALGGHKGGAQLFDVAAALPDEVVVIALGYLEGQLERGWASDRHRRLATHPGAKRIYVSGAYAPAELPGLFAHYRPQLVYFPALVPESFAYTLSETWACGAIPVLPALGALGERASAETAVVLDQPADAAAVAACLGAWSRIEARERREAVRARIGALLPQIVPPLHAMTERFETLYERLGKRRAAPADAAALDDLARLCDMNLDPAQFRTELYGMLEENRALRTQDAERRQWNEKLERDVAELKARNGDVEVQLADLAGTLRGEVQLADLAGSLRRQAEEQLAAANAQLTLARATLGESPSEWPRYGRAVRVARKIPGYLALLDLLAEWRKRWP